MPLRDNAVPLSYCIFFPEIKATPTARFPGVKFQPQHADLIHGDKLVGFPEPSTVVGPSSM